MRQFGDKWQISKAIDGRRYWRVPVMDGEFLVESRSASPRNRSAAAIC